MSKRTALCFILIMMLVSGFNFLTAQEFVPGGTIETSLSYDYLTPEDEYADWKSADLRYTIHFSPRNTLTFAGGGSVRDEKFGWLQAGIYHDWTSRFYTYTGVTTSSSSKWMGRWRFDNDLNFKLGPEKQYILALGQTAILYPDDKEDYILSAGGIWYRKHFILDYRHFFTRSDPGEVWSDSDRISIGFGTMGKSWTTVTASMGNQSYLALGGLLEVDQNVYSISLMEQVWLKEKCGLKIGAGYQKVEDGFEKYNFSLGCFHSLP
jgi:YaiO family outer membrane protein